MEGMTMKKKLQGLFYKIHKPKMKAKYQFGSPIVGVYQYQHYLVIATKLDVYITEDGINYVRAKHDI